MEAVIIGKNLDEKTIAAAAEAAVINAMPIEKNGYKVPLFEGVMAGEFGKMAAG